MAFVMCEVNWGLGRHRYFIKPTKYIAFLKYNWLDWNQVIITLYLCKLSICLFLLRISKFDRWRIFLYWVIAFLTLSHLPLELLYLLQCIPIQKNWNQSRPGKCFSLVAVEKIIIVQGGKHDPSFWDDIFFVPAQRSRHTPSLYRPPVTN